MGTPVRIHADLALLHCIRTNFTYALATAVTTVFAQAIGDVPNNSFISNVQLAVTTLFNGGTTNVVTVGKTGSTSVLMAAGDNTPGTAAGYSKAIALTLAADTEYNVYYNYTGTAPTTGNADVLVSYYPQTN